MKHLIDKSAVVAEMERRKKAIIDDNGNLGFKDCQKAFNEIDELKKFINTLEVKEVDLEKYYHDFLQKEWFGNSHVRTVSEIMAFTAKHFFELGIAVSNPVTAADRGTAEEIIINLKRIEEDYHIDLTKEMEWLRNKVKKGENI